MDVQTAVGRTIVKADDTKATDALGQSVDATLTLDDGRLIVVRSCGCCGGASLDVETPKEKRCNDDQVCSQASIAVPVG